ncbi:MAG TPA: hypothetical protein VE684_20370, partial [Crenalkalicoccus sp.]|nr:hypothetical protein [Crenalkalicoccus sp.]
MQHSKLRRGMGRLIDSYAEGLIERAEFEPWIAGFRQRIQAWEAQAKALQDEVAQRHTLPLILGRLEDFAHHMQDRRSELDWHKRREPIRFLVKRVEIDHERINVVLRIGPPSPRSDQSGIGAALQNCSRRDHPGSHQEPGGIWSLVPPRLPHGAVVDSRTAHPRRARILPAATTGWRERRGIGHGGAMLTRATAAAALLLYFPAGPAPAGGPDRPAAAPPTQAPPPA